MVESVNKYESDTSYPVIFRKFVKFYFVNNYNYKYFMSRVGKKPVIIPSGVKVEKKDLTLTVTGPKGL